MATYIIPLEPVQNQTFSIDIEDKRCDFKFFTQGLYLYMNLAIDDKDVINGVICLNKAKLNQYVDIGLKGSLYFEDTNGNLDPIYYGLGSRWILNYEEADV